MGPRRDRALGFALLTAAAACLALAGARVAANLAQPAPPQLVTSGAEQEALDSIWRFTRGQPVYTDPHAIPYTASCFNWLFYALYGSVAGGALRLLHGQDAWLPTFCRFLTLGLAAAGAAVFALILPRAGGAWRLTAALALLAFFNPLCGFWIMTARPDIGAAMLELVGVAFFFRYLRQGALRWIIPAALALYGAWAFKQTSFGALGGIALNLLLLRRERALLLLGAIWLGGVITTAALLGPAYRQQLYLGQIHSGFGVTWALPHLGLALLKMPLMAVALLDLARTWNQSRADSIERAVGWILLATLALDGVAATKAGAGDYYFLSLGVWSTLWLGLRLVTAFHAPSGSSPPRDFFLRGTLTAAAAFILLGAAAVLSGRCGTIGCGDPRLPYEHLAHYLADRPGPVFVQDPYGDLPWISPTQPHFVIAFNNRPDERAGLPFERGGWQGLLAQGYFSTVVTKTGDCPINAALLAPHYRLAGGEAGWNYFERRPEDDPKRNTPGHLPSSQAGDYFERK